MKPQKIARIVVTLKAQPGVHNVIAQAKAIHAAVAANPGYFPSPSPTLATLAADIAALETAQIFALTKAKGAIEARDAKLRIVLDALIHLKGYVQVVANADPSNAEAITTAAAMFVRKARSGTKQDLTVKQGAVSGSVNISAKSAGPRAAYDWQWSLDEKAWTDVPSTIQAHTSVPNLSLGVVHYFRFRPLTKAGRGDWSQVVNWIVK